MKIKRKQWEAMQATIIELDKWRDYVANDVRVLRETVQIFANDIRILQEGIQTRLDKVEREFHTLLDVWTNHADTLPDHPIDVVQLENDHRVLMEIQVEYSNLVRENIVPLTSALADMRDQVDTLWQSYLSYLQKGDPEWEDLANIDSRVSVIEEKLTRAADPRELRKVVR